MFPPPGAVEHRPRGGALQWLQLPNRIDAQTLASGHEDRRGADHFHRPFSRHFQDVAQNRPGSAADGVAFIAPESLPAFAAEKSLNASARAVPAGRCAGEQVGRASSRPVLGASCPNQERRDYRALKRGWKPLEPAGADACPSVPGRGLVWRDERFPPGACGANRSRTARSSPQGGGAKGWEANVRPKEHKWAVRQDVGGECARNHEAQEPLTAFCRAQRRERKEQTLTRGDPRLERGGEVSRGHSSD